MEKRNRVSVKIGALQQYVVWHYCQSLTDNIRVAEFPKSGGTWLCRMLAEMFELPYPRNEFWRLRRCIYQSHYKGPTRYKTIYLVRDGRDVMISAYFHFLLHTASTPKPLIEQWLKKMKIPDPENIRTHLPKFIKIFSEQYKISNTRISWSDHVFSYKVEDDSILLVKYEDLLHRAKDELMRIADWYHFIPKIELDRVIEKYSFENLKKSLEGKPESQFIRKGIAGDWQNYFSEDALSVFNQLHRGAMNYLKYD